MRALIVDSHYKKSRLVDDLSTLFSCDVDVVGTSEETIAYLRKYQVKVVFIKYQLIDISGVSLASLIKKTYPDINVFVVCDEHNYEKWKQVTSARAIYLSIPINIDHIKHICFIPDPEDKKGSLINKEDSKEKKISEEVALKTEKKIEEAKTEQDKQDTNTSPIQKRDEVINVQKPIPIKSKKKSQKVKNIESNSTIVTVFSPKGGVGKTTTAVNLATLVKTELLLKTVVLEFTRQTGNVLGHFSTNHTVDIRSWIDYYHSENQWPDDVEDMLLWCPTTEVAILPTQKLIDENRFQVKISPEHVEGIVETLSQYFDLIIIDGGTILDDTFYRMLALSDYLIMVSKIERETLQDCHYLKHALINRGIDQERMIHVLNQGKNGLGITIKKALEVVGIDNNHVIHFDKDVEKIPAEKEPFLIRQKKRGSYYDEIWSLASMIINHPEFEEGSAGSWIDKLKFWEKSG